MARCPDLGHQEKGVERASLGGPDGLEEVCSVKSHGAGMMAHGALPALPANSGLEVLLGLAVRPRPLVGPLRLPQHRFNEPTLQTPGSEAERRSMATRGQAQPEVFLSFGETTERKGGNHPRGVTHQGLKLGLFPGVFTTPQLES